MIIPYTVDVPMERMPIANWALIGLTSLISVIIFIGEVHHGGIHREPDLSKEDFERLRQFEKELEEKNLPDEQIDKLVLQEVKNIVVRSHVSSLALNPRSWNPLQLVTCLFVHGDLLHLIGNMVFLFVFGNAVNAKMGHVPFLVSYFMLGACASIAWMILGDGNPAVGASGAIMGIVGIFLVLFPLNDISIFYFFSLYFSGTYSLSSYIVIVFYLLGDLWGTVRGGGGIAYVAHLGGMFAGVTFASIALFLDQFKPTRYERNLLQVLGLKEFKKKKRKKKRIVFEEEHEEFVEEDPE